MIYPLVSIIVTTKNSANTLAKTLQSIRNQSYPKEKIEILIVDGGSEDMTRGISRKFGVKTINNPNGGFIQGKHIGYIKARGTYVMYLDSDEELYNPDSLKLKISTFLSDKRIKGVVSSGYISPKNSSFINRYINELGDPFSFFIYGSTINYKFFLQSYLNRYIKKKESDTYIAFDFSSTIPLPLIELVAMGCMIDKNYTKSIFPEVTTNPNLIPHFFYLLNRTGSLIAITKHDPIIHNSADTMERYLKKIAWRVRNNIFSKKTAGIAGFEGRDLFQQPMQRWKKYLFIPYSSSIFLPLFDAFRLSFSRRDVVFLLHPYLCIYTSFLIIYYYLLGLIGIKPFLKTYGT